MYSQLQSAPILSNFLINNINYHYIYQLPYNNNPRVLASQTKSYKLLTGKSLLKQNIICEANRLQVNDKRIINLVVDHIWNCLNSSLKVQFTTLANNANDINLKETQVNAANLNRIAQLNVEQFTSNLFEDNFFNGVKFCDNDNNSNINSNINDNSIEFSILCSGSSFP